MMRRTPCELCTGQRSGSAEHGGGEGGGEVCVCMGIIHLPGHRLQSITSLSSVLMCVYFDMWHVKPYVSIGP